MTDWQPLQEELARRRVSGQTARLWWRDDDAIEPTAALDRLLALCEAHRVPVTLAVIPAHSGASLAARLRRSPLAAAAVHGWSHANHAPAGEKKQELGPHRPRAAMRAELAMALARLRDFHGARSVPMLVPPWNRIDADLVAELAPLGYRALSTFGAAASVVPPPLRLVNTQVDIIDWKGTRGGREGTLLVRELAGELRRAAAADGEAIGVLTHHLAHDEPAWNFLEALLALTAGHPACRWLSARELLGEDDGLPEGRG